MITYVIDTSVYDAAFMALAKENDAILITANPKHQAKAINVKVLSLVDFN